MFDFDVPLKYAIPTFALGALPFLGFIQFNQAPDASPTLLQRAAIVSPGTGAEYHDALEALGGTPGASTEEKFKNMSERQILLLVNMMPCFATTLQMHQKYGFGEPQNDCVVKYTNAEKSAALVTTSIAYGVNRRRITAEVTVAENGSAMDWKVKNFDISGVYVATGR